MAGFWFRWCAAPLASAQMQEEEEVIVESAKRHFDQPSLHSEGEQGRTTSLFDLELAKVASPVSEVPSAGTASSNMDTDEPSTDALILEDEEEDDESEINSLGDGQQQQEVSDDEGLQERKLREFLGGRASLSDISPNLSEIGGRRASLEGTTLEDYVHRHAGVFDKLLAFEKDERWEHKKSIDGLEVHQFFDDHHQMVAVKGSIKMDCGKMGGLAEVVEAMLTPANRPKYDETCISGTMIEQRLPYYRISYMQIATPSPMISNRDVLVLGRLKFLEDGTLLLAAESTEHPDVPPNPDFVRLKLPSTGFIFRPTEDAGIYTVTFVGVADPGGWLPSWLKRMVAWKQALTLSVFKQKYGL